jgi:hypothetical protein
MPTTAPSCSVYACHDAATFVLLPDDELCVVPIAPTDCLCTEHWLQLRLYHPERAYQYVSIRYASVRQPEPVGRP